MAWIRGRGDNGNMPVLHAGDTGSTPVASTMKRSVIIKFKDGSSKELELGRATLVKVEKPFLNLEQLKDGKWRLIWSEGLIEDFSQVEGFEIRREG